MMLESPPPATLYGIVFWAVNDYMMEGTAISRDLKPQNLMRDRSMPPVLPLARRFRP